MFVDSTKVFDSIHKGKMEEILLAYSPPKESVIYIMMPYEHTKVTVYSPDDDRFHTHCHCRLTTRYINNISIYNLT